MDKKDKLDISHTILYAKGWYKRFDPQGRGKRKSLMDDLRVLLAYDVLRLTDDVITNDDVVRILSSRLQRMKGEYFNLQGFIEGISPQQCWKHGYYTKNCYWIKDQELPDYDFNTAVAYYIISELGSLSVDKWQLVLPDYNLLPRNNRVKDKMLHDLYSRVVEFME